MNTEKMIRSSKYGKVGPVSHRRSEPVVKFGFKMSAYLAFAAAYGTWEIFSDLTRWVF